MAKAPGSTLLLEELFEAGDPRFLDELLRFEGEPQLGAWAERLFADRRPFARAMWLAYVDDGCTRVHHRALVKRLFKKVEAAGDDEGMAHFLVAFDRFTRREIRQVQRWDWQTRESHTEFELAKVPLPSGRSAFSRPTRQYLTRRAWRYFRLLGWRDPARYGRAIRLALPLYQDEHLAQSEQVLDAWGLVHALYHGSTVLWRQPDGVDLAQGRTLAELEPAPFRPDVWRDCQDELFALVERAGSRTVRAWAIAWLRKHYRLTGLSLERVRTLLASGHDEVQLFGAELLQSAVGLESLPIREWLSLLAIENATVVGLVCALVEKHVAPARVKAEECVQLAHSRLAPVASLGLRWLRDKRGVHLDAVVELGEAPVTPVRTEAVDWLIDRIRGAEGKPEHLRELIDARHADTRARALTALAAEPRFREAPAMWAALPESPYDDVRAHLVAHLEERRAALPDGSLRHVWVTSLLAVHRGGRAKPEVARQIAHRIVEHPKEAADLVPLLAIALRSLRRPEKQAALAALVRAAEARPTLRDELARGLPELRILDDAATARASIQPRAGA